MTDDELDGRVRASLLAEQLDTSRLEHAVRSQIHPTLRHVPRWAAIAAGILAMIAASIFSYRTFLQEKNTPAVCIAAAQDHKREIVKGEARHWLTDLSAIQSLATQQGVPASAIIALSTTNYRLQRARLCFLEKQIYLHLVYTRDGDVYSVYLRPRANDPKFSLSVRDAKIGAEDLAYFQTNDLMAVFVSHTPGADPAAFARAGASVL
jgi:hypothetical protein